MSVTLSGKVETGEVYITAGHKGNPQVVTGLGRKVHRRKLRGKRGRGILGGEKPPMLGMLQRSGEVVIQMVPNVQHVTIKPLITETVAPGSMIYTNENEIIRRGLSKKKEGQPLSRLKKM